MATTELTLLLRNDTNRPAMAVSLSTVFLPNTPRPTVAASKTPVPLFDSQSTSHGSFSLLRGPATSLVALGHRSLVVCSAISGSTGIESWGSVDEDAPNLLDTVKVFGLDGNGIPISDIWKDRKAVVAFARHFGCVFCRKRADYLASKKEIMDRSGVALALIGPGSVDQARTFYQQTNFKGEVYADPSHSSYEALKFVSGVLTTFTPKAGLKIIELYMEGYRQDWKLSFEKDTVSKGGWQQGGIIVAGPGKTNISYIHRDKEAGDDPDIEDILKVCCS